MKIAVNPKTKIERVPAGTEEIHMVRPIKAGSLSELIKGIGVKKISLSASCYSRMSEKARKILQETGVEIAQENRRGRALELSSDTILKIGEYKGDYKSIREIARLTGEPKSTVHYLLKYADRGKIRKGNQTIYLK